MLKKKIKSRNIKDSSKRQLMVRIEKRERLMAFAFAFGNFKFLGRTLSGISKYSLEIPCPTRQIAKCVYGLLKPVTWINIEFIPENNTIIVNDIFSKHRLRLIRKNIMIHSNKNLRHGYHYLYSPLFVFALFLRMGDDKFNLTLPQDFDVENTQYIKEWFKSICHIDCIVEDRKISFNSDGQKRIKEFLLSDKRLEHYLELLSIRIKEEMPWQKRRKQ